MKYNPDIHHRKSLRLQGYDYSQEGAYFVTICAQNRECLFGSVADGKMILNDAGRMIGAWWKKLFEKFPNIIMDEYVIMPNHTHGIVQIVWENVMEKGENMVSPLRMQRVQNTYDGLGRYISWFKRMSTNEYIRNVKQNNWQPFHKRIWQQNYYEHIIRDENDLNRIREYIINNPVNWEKDELYT
jgi:putative transposase